jgi:hypothetical protein
MLPVKPRKKGIKADETITIPDKRVIHTVFFIKIKAP